MPVLTHINHNGSPKPAAPAGVKRLRGLGAACLETDANAPEWKTDAWKRQVEAEARSRLKDRIHDIGARR